MSSIDLLLLHEHAEKLEPNMRKKLAEAWLNAALDEHASIAAFSRFSLHLMALAAPPQLLGNAHQAALDELEHAKLCFAIYEVYAGEPAAPSPMNLPQNLLGPLTPEAIVGAAVAEGCVGETIAAHEAQQLAELCEPIPLKTVLKQIAIDEQKHAELAWKFIAWALKRFGSSVQKSIDEAFIATCVHDDTPYFTTDEDAIYLAHGIAPPKLKSELRTSAIDEVIRPLRHALIVK